MSVRVNDLLKLPSLREATVLSGKTNWTHLLLLFLLEVSDMSLFRKNFTKQMNTMLAKF